MKRALAATLLLLGIAGSVFAYGDYDFETILMMGITPGAADGHEISSGSTSVATDTEMGFSMSLEGYIHTADMFGIGIGMGVLLPQPLEDDSLDPMVNFVPVYVTAMLHGNMHADTYAYMTLQYGVNIVYGGNDDYSSSADLEGRAYTAAALGLGFSNDWRVELKYAIYEGVADLSGFDMDVEHTVFSLMFGRSF